MSHRGHTKIFLSYRRDDTRSDARLLRRELEAAFARDEVFRDIDDIELGEDWRDRVRGAVKSAEVMIVLIGRGWLTATDATGARKIDSADDPVRLELESAMAAGVRIIPVYIDAARQLTYADLPAGLRPLADYHSYRISDETYNEDVRRLLSALPRSELALWEVAGAAALGGLAWDMARPLLNSGLITRSGVDQPHFLGSPLLASASYGLLAFFILLGLRRVLRLSIQRIIEAAGIIALFAAGGGLLAQLVFALGAWGDELSGRVINPVARAAQWIVVAVGSIVALARARGAQPPPAWRLVLLIGLGALAGEVAFDAMRLTGHVVWDQRAISLAVGRAAFGALFGAGVLLAMGAHRAWGRASVASVCGALGAGACVGDVALQLMRHAANRFGGGPQTFNLAMSLLYSAIAIFLFLVIGRLRLAPAVVPHRYRIGLPAIVLVVALAVAFVMSKPRTRAADEPSPAVLRILELMRERGWITVEEAERLRAQEAGWHGRR